MAEDLMLRRIHVASDAKVVIDDTGRVSGGLYGPVIREIDKERRRFEDCNFVHEGRASSHEAHNFAKFALSLGPGRHLRLGCPRLNFVFTCLFMLIFFEGRHPKTSYILY